MVGRRIRVLIVDDHRIVSDGIAAILRNQADFEVVGCAATGDEALVLFRDQRPDITLMDLRLPGMSGLEAISAILTEDNEARVIVLTMYGGDEDIFRALAAGAATYLLKDTLARDLIRTIRAVHAGKRPLPAAVKARLAERASHETLTHREIEVLQLAAEGMRNKEIAARLEISEQTVQVHMKNVHGKLHVRDRVAAINLARRRGIIHSADAFER